MKQLIALFLTGFGVVWLFNDSSPDQVSVAVAASTASGGVKAAADLATCDGGEAIGDVVAVAGDYELRSGPSESADKIVNTKLSEALGKRFYQTVDQSETVRRVCAGAEWTQIQVVTPDYLTHVNGWVPNTALRGIERTASGHRLYVEEDFCWDEDTSAFQPQIVEVVNQIARENSGCSKIDTGTLTKSSSRSSPGDPVFFITCGASMDVFNVWAE